MNRNLAIFLIFIMKLKSVKADAQRKRLAAVWGFEIRPPVTAAWLCFLLKLRTFAWLYSSSWN